MAGIIRVGHEPTDDVWAYEVTRPKCGIVRATHRRAEVARLVLTHCHASIGWF